MNATDCSALLILILACDLGLQSPTSYGHDPLYTCKKSKLKVSPFESESGNRRTDEDTTDCITRSVPVDNAMVLIQAHSDMMDFNYCGSVGFEVFRR